MLILTRRMGESLMIGRNVSITVIGIKGGQVRLGVSAPPEVTVHREEIYHRLAAESGAVVLTDQAVTPDSAEKSPEKLTGQR